MPLPSREYFYLPEVMEKLEMTEFDLRYYMSHGYLLGSVFINAEMQREDTARRGNFLPPRLCEGRVYLDPISCRALFASGELHEKYFYFIYPDERIAIPINSDPILIRLTDLVISTIDLNLFIKRYNMNAPDARPANAGGRPSLKKKVMAEHFRRITAREARKTKSHEALALRAWSQVHLKDGAPPSTNTIRGWLSEAKT